MLERRRLGDDAEEVAGGDGRHLLRRAARTSSGARGRAPAASTPRGSSGRPNGVVAVAGQHFERALRAVEDAPEQAGTELDFQRPAGVEHRLADAQARRVLVDLDRGVLAVEADDLAGERGLADAHDVVQPHAVEAAGDHDRAGDTPDLAGRLDGLVVERRVAAVVRWSWSVSFVAERDARSRRPGGASAAAARAGPRPASCVMPAGSATTSGTPQRVESPPQRSFERVEVRSVHRDDAVLPLEQLLEPRRGLRGRGDLDRAPRPPSR